MVEAREGRGIDSVAMPPTAARLGAALRLTLILTLASTAAAAPQAIEEDASPDAWERVDDRPPLALRWAEVLPEGGWRLAYEYRIQSFDDLRDGRDEVSRSEILSTGAVEIPEEVLWMEHVFELGWGWTEFTTLFLRVPFLDKELDGYVAGGGGDLDQESSGLGDVLLGVSHYCCASEEGGRLMLHAGVSAPTGSIDEEDDGPGGDQRLPYPMQLGTGTWDLHGGAAWIQNEEEWTWGVALRGRLDLGRNDEDYAVSDAGVLDLWASLPFDRDVLLTLGLRTSFWGDMHGEDDELDPDVDPLDDEHRQGGLRTDLILGAGWELGDARDANRLELELGIPIDEWLDGPQMSTEWLLGVGWRYSF